MQLNDQELQDLATFFARRAPSIEERDLFRKRARLSLDNSQTYHPRTGWLQILVEATDRGKLGRLAYVISAEHPGDRNLQQVCQLLAERGNASGVKQAAMFGIPICAFAMVLFFWPHGEFTEIQPQSQAMKLQPQSVEEAASEAVATLQPQSIEETSTPQKLEVIDALPKVSPTGQEAVALVTTTTAPPQTRPTHVPCDPEHEDIIGYWYSGDDPAGARGETITIAKTVNVRTEYPSFRNDYSPRSPVQCVLFEGEQLHLSQDPILVSGDRYWIPITGTDLIRS
jgi:hypothetical protein